MVINLVKKFIKLIYCLPKTIYFNFYYLSFKEAIKFPIYVHGSVKIGNMGNRKAIKLCSLKRGSVRLGMSEGSFEIKNKNCWWNISKGAKVTFKGNADLSRGFNFEVAKDAYVEIGNDFACNVNVIITSAKQIIFGNNCLIGWNVSFMDGDGHKILYKNTKEIINKNKDIKIGNNVWIGACSTILKGTNIKNNSVIAYRSIVTNKFDEEGCIILNNSVIKRNIEWKK
ncbi:MAG: acyltransferase [Clostridium sp.]|nr:acyltransferase [Clostridium sp.]MCI7442980.1 acyltransferase [Clostridium sp.]